MTKTLIDIDDDLMANAMEALDAKTKAEAVRTALMLVTQLSRQRKALEWFAETGALDALNDPEVKASAWR